MKRIVDSCLLVMLCAGLAWFYVWTVRSSGDKWKFGLEQRDYYNLLIDGYLAGQLHMKVEVPPELLQLKDPYDPNLRPAGLGLHDASFYKGKYYVYFGAAPMVVLMLPFRLITGFDLPQPVAALVFVYAGFLASVAILLAARRRYFPDTGALVLSLCVLVLGLAGLGPVLLRRPHMWELPIGAGYCFAMLTLGCVWGSLHAGRRRALWYAGAGLSLGLAIASRPTYLIASPLLAAPLLFWWITGKGGEGQRPVPWREMLAVAAPLVVIGGLMAWHNYARFDSPWQFGQAYQFSFDYEAKVAHFRASHVPFNAWRYFFSAAQWSPYFPFIHPAEMPPKPPGFGGHDDVYGVLTNMPVAWLALVAPLALWRRNAGERGPLGTWLVAAVLLFTAMTGVLLFFFGSLARYESDFTPALMLLAVVGVLALERWLRETRGGARAAARVLWGGAALVSAGFAVVFSVQLDGLLGERNPSKARELAQSLNRVPALFERALGAKHGAAEVTLRLPAQPPGDRTLLTVGDPPTLDRLFVRYLDRERVQLGFAQGVAPEILSRPLRIDFNSLHLLRATLGSLYPPPTHPLFAERSPAEIARFTHQLRIEFDGETVIRESRRFESGTGRLRAGRAALAGRDTRFEGEASGLRRLAADVEPGNGQRTPGFLRLRVSFPERPPMPREPLFALGDDVSGGVVFVHYHDDSGKISFGSSVRGERSPLIEPLAVDFNRVHEFVARWTPAKDATRRRLELRLDGTIVSSREVAWLEREGSPVAGKNVGGEPGCAPQFTGRIHSVQRGVDGNDPLIGGGNTLKLQVLLPRGRNGVLEPLVVTGRNSAGDLLMIEYVDERTVRFALDHWGSASRRSEPVRLDFARTHDFEVTLASLAGPADATLERHVRRGSVSVTVDGTPVWREETEFFTAEAEEFAIGRNPIGGTSGGPLFTGDVLAAVRLKRE